MIKGEASALALRLLVQILVKIHGGARCGRLDAEILDLASEAEVMAQALERGEGGIDD